jgi:hypothetical protein
MSAERQDGRQPEGLEAVRTGDFGSGEPGEAQAGARAFLERLAAHCPAMGRLVDEAELGRGGMGRVLKVWDEDLRRHMAMKVMLERVTPGPDGELAVDEKTLTRFLEEAQVTGQLDHPGIVPVHELGIDS